MCEWHVYCLSANLYITNYVFLCFCNLNSLVTNSTFVSSEFLQIYRTFKKMILPSDFSILNVILVFGTTTFLQIDSFLKKYSTIKIQVKNIYFDTYCIISPFCIVYTLSKQHRTRHKLN